MSASSEVRAPLGTLGPFDLLELLGSGGQGCVYRAVDRRLGREVAVKVLPQELALRPGRLERLRREARLLARLNHPHIASLHEVGSEHGVPFLVLEMVEGGTLADRIARGPLAVAEALPLLIQLAEAIEHAHRHGVVHRDLKPTNVKITSEHQVKVLDFGIGKLIAESEGASPITPAPDSGEETADGSVLGTLAYMCPEQTRGGPIDRQCDIWAFGCLLFEALSGEPAFRRATTGETLAAILRESPRWHRLPKDTPQEVTWVLRRCLDKQRRHRLHDIGDARVELEEALRAIWTRARTRGPRPRPEPVRTARPSAEARERHATPPNEADTLVEPGAPHRRWHSTAGRIVPWAIASVALVVAFAVALAPGRSPTHSPPVQRLVLAGHVAEPSVHPIDGWDWASAPALAPDGSRVAFRSGDRLWIQDLATLESLEVPSSQDPRAIFWSPDGSMVLWASGDSLWRMPAAGGEPIPISSLPHRRVLAGAWTAGDRILISEWQGSLYELPATGGDLRPLRVLGPEREVDVHRLTALPKRDAVLLEVHLPGKSRIELLEGRRRTVVLELDGGISARHPAYDPRGRLLFWQPGTESSIWAIPFDPGRRRTSGPARLVVRDASMPSVSRQGSLIYVRGVLEDSAQLFTVSPSGTRIALGEPLPELSSPRVSLDGTNILALVHEKTGTETSNAWLFDSSTGARIQVTFTHTVKLSPRFHPDGERLVYSRRGARQTDWEIVSQRLDGDGEVSVLAHATGGTFALSPEGDRLVYSTPGSEGDLMLLDLTGHGEPSPLVSTSGRQQQPEISPDGRLLAYVSDESGELQVYLTRFPSGEGKWQVSHTPEAGRSAQTRPRFSADSDALYLRSLGAVLRAELTGAPLVPVGAPTPVYHDDGGFSYDLFEDGRLLVVGAPHGADGPRLVWTRDWLAGLAGQE